MRTGLLASYMHDDGLFAVQSFFPTENFSLPTNQTWLTNKPVCTCTTKNIIKMISFQMLRTIFTYYSFVNSCLSHIFLLRSHINHKFGSENRKQTWIWQKFIIFGQKRVKIKKLIERMTPNFSNSIVFSPKIMNSPAHKSLLSTLFTLFALNSQKINTHMYKHNLFSSNF